jgi:hypothetical protein
MRSRRRSWNLSHMGREIVPLVSATALLLPLIASELLAQSTRANSPSLPPAHGAQQTATATTGGKRVSLDKRFSCNARNDRRSLMQCLVAQLIELNQGGKVDPALYTNVRTFAKQQLPPPPPSIDTFWEWSYVAEIDFYGDVKSCAEGLTITEGLDVPVTNPTLQFKFLQRRQEVLTSMCISSCTQFPLQSAYCSKEALVQVMLDAAHQRTRQSANRLGQQAQTSAAVAVPQ